MTLGQIWTVVRHPLGSLKRELTCMRDWIPGTLACVATREPVAALTFDDGPHPEYTPRLLDILAKYSARATFFMVGEVAQKHPDLVKKVAQFGHAVGNHTWDHPYLPDTPARVRRDQIRACQRMLVPHGQPLFRPPYGAQSLASFWDALRLGYKVVTWNIMSNDWLPQTPETIADRLTAQIRPGSIVLLHDAIYRSNQPVPQFNREPMLHGLELFLERTRHLRFVTVPELLRMGRARSWDRPVPRKQEDQPLASAY